jgi:acetylornithine deacetylase/succinyl-diaminopimelate desuccinylase-like protein
MGLPVSRHPVPAADVQAYGLQSITNLIVRRAYGDGGPTVALNAHGDVVPRARAGPTTPTAARSMRRRPALRPRLGGQQERLRHLHLRTARAGSRGPPRGAIELHFTYDEEFGGELGPGWLLAQGLTRPDLLIAAGFSYQVVTAHNGCLQLEVTLHGTASHAAYPTPASMRCRPPTGC